MKLKELNDDIIKDLFAYLSNIKEDYILYKFAKHLDIITETVTENNEYGINDLLEYTDPYNILYIENLIDENDPLIYRSGDSICSCEFEDLIEFNNFENALLDIDTEDIEDALNYIGSDYNLFKDDRLCNTLNSVSDSLKFSIKKLEDLDKLSIKNLEYLNSSMIKELKNDLDHTNTKIKNIIDCYKHKDR